MGPQRALFRSWQVSGIRLQRHDNLQSSASPELTPAVSPRRATKPWWCLRPGRVDRSSEALVSEAESPIIPSYRRHFGH